MGADAADGDSLMPDRLFLYFVAPSTELSCEGARALEARRRARTTRPRRAHRVAPLRKRMEE
jgi:hypothetical protein